jgi:hypothetical protein
MTEENKKPASATQAEAAKPAVANKQESTDLTVQDLNVIKSIIDVASQRGAFKANEMQAVGTTYNKLEAFLNIIQAQQQAAAAKNAPTAPAGDKK